ncbi:MAG: hypothetical protein HY965_04100 [Ignavibacteriales bacterium]|nr:hypothetical protein [Ignavibacteriales bacterium]
MKRTILLSLIGCGVFFFLHSEMGLLDHDSDNHGSHDYCEIVKNSNTQTKTLKEFHPKIEINKTICAHCFLEDQAVLSRVWLQNFPKHPGAKYGTKIYLFNDSFLI